MVKTPQVGIRIRKRLQEIDRDQKWLAKMLNKDPSMVSRMLDGSRRISVDDLREIGLVLHRPVAWLMGEADTVELSTYEEALHS